MQRNRIDRIKSLEVTKYNATDMSTSQENTTLSHDTCTIHFLTLDGYKEAYSQFFTPVQTLSYKYLCHR